MTTPAWIALAAALFSLASACAAVFNAFMARRALDMARRESEINVRMFQRQFIFQLHEAWDGIHSVLPNSPNTEDALRGCDALRLTASVWLNEIVDQEILYDNYRDNYVELYDALQKVEQDLPGMNRSGRELLTKAVTTVYNKLKEKDDASPHRSVVRPSS